MSKGKDVQLTISDFCPKFSEGEIPHIGNLVERSRISQKMAADERMREQTKRVDEGHSINSHCNRVIQIDRRAHNVKSR